MSEPDDTDDLADVRDYVCASAEMIGTGFTLKFSSAAKVVLIVQPVGTKRVYWTANIDPRRVREQLAETVEIMQRVLAEMDDDADAHDRRRPN